MSAAFTIAPARLIAFALGFMSIISAALASEPDPGPQSISREIDRRIDLLLEQESVTPAPQADDFTFARRVTLDLAGRIPTPIEVRQFVESTDANKRELLVDGLLNSPDYALHLANELDVLLLARIKQDNDWREYLTEASHQNRGWDQIFREIMTPERERPGEPGPAAFLRERVKDLDTLTNDASSLLFGVNISCAKCHDHPLVVDWEQQHYFGMASFFKRTYSTKANLLSEQFDGRLKFTDVSGDEHAARFMFLSGSAADEPEVDYDKDHWKDVKDRIKRAQKDAKAEPPPLPEFSPRAELVRLALESDGASFFSRNMVNRTWARLMGHGLVNPLDQMHSENPASHPALLDWLAEDFSLQGYNLRRLIRGIVLTEAYARSIRHPEIDNLPPELFAVAVPRALTPRQLTASLGVAIQCSELAPQQMEADQWRERRTSLENAFNSLRAALEIPDANFQVGTDEALLFSNSDGFQKELLRDAQGQLIGRLEAIDDLDAMIETACLAILSRPPEPEEQQALLQYVSARKDRRSEAIKQIVWALTTTPEFRFNH